VKRNFKQLQSDWNTLGNEDPLWAVLSCPDKRGRKWDVEDFFATGKSEIKLLMEEITSLSLPSMKRQSAMDFGCGVGRLTSALSDFFDEVKGIDISSSMLKRAREYNKNNSRCIFIENNSPDIKIIPDQSMDLIYSSITLQHIPVAIVKNYIREFVRIIKPSGVVVFQVPSAYEWTLRGFSLRVVPDFILKHIRKRVYNCGSPIAMHCIPLSNINKTVTSSAGKIIHLRPDPAAGNGWISYRYFVQKG